MTHLASLSTAALRNVFANAHEQGDAVTADACWAIFVSRQLNLDGTRRDPIVTSHVCPPIPIREFDWAAHRDSDEGGERCTGYGRTEAEAIANLVDYELDLADGEALDAAADEAAGHDAEAERAAEQAEYERDAAADDRRDARRDDPFERWPDELGA